MPALSSNNLTKQVDLPTWEWTRFAPAVSSAVSSTCSADNPDFLQTEHGRYLYYLISATQFVRYDTWTDMYQQLSSPPVSPFNVSAMKLAGAYGPEGKVIAATSTTLTLPSISMEAMRGYDVTIISGTGAGQRRRIIDVAEPVVHDSGIVTAVANALGGITLTDTLKTWSVNQWAGYTVRIAGNSGLGQYRRILSNAATVLTVGDSTQMNMRFNNPAIFAPAIASTAGAQSAYVVESQVVTLDSAWAVTPDTTSVFRIQSGMIMLVSPNAATATAPFYLTQLYDILTDTWYVLPTMTNIITAAVTDLSLERTSENASIWANGTATGGTTTTLIDASMGVERAAWGTNQWANYWVYISSGTGEGQIRQIASNTGTTLTWATAGTAPTAGSRYQIIGFDAGIATAGAASTLTDSTKSWAVNRWANYCVRILAGTGAGQVRPIVSNTSTVLTVIGTWDTNPDSTSVFSIQGDPDKAYIFGGGIAAAPIINFSSQVQSFGRQQDWGIARNASCAVGGYQPVAITTLANATTTATATTAHPHQFRVGELVTVRGATDANFNVTNVAIATVPSATTFTYTMAGTPAATTIPGTQSTTTLTDASKAWTTNQWAGFTLYMYAATPTAASGATTGQVVRIISNTATTLTLSHVVTAPTNGISRYAICTSSAIGAVDFGVATGTHSTTTLQDTTKTWPVNIHAGKRARIVSGPGSPAEAIVSSNTANTLTFSAALGSAPVSAQTGYILLEATPKGLGVNANWAFGTTDANMRGRYVYCTRGGATFGFDRWDVTTDRVNPIATSPLTETLTTGTMTAYDGTDRIYFHKDATQRVYSLNVVTANVNGASMYPYAAPTAIIGNRMEVFTTKDGLKYLWLNRASFAECFRCLLFW
jgi:hypothetical protein